MLTCAFLGVELLIIVGCLLLPDSGDLLAKNTQANKWNEHVDSLSKGTHHSAQTPHRTSGSCYPRVNPGQPALTLAVILAS